MSYYALIKNGIVENIISADAAFIASLPNSANYVQYTNAGIGWSYDGANFIPPKCHDVAILDNQTHNWTCEDVSHNVTI